MSFGFSFPSGFSVVVCYSYQVLCFVLVLVVSVFSVWGAWFLVFVFVVSSNYFDFRLIFFFCVIAAILHLRCFISSFFRLSVLPQGRAMFSTRHSSLSISRVSCLKKKNDRTSERYTDFNFHDLEAAGQGRRTPDPYDF